jgi:predicted nucleotidyltransferase component of viral defense system
MSSAGSWRASLSTAKLAETWVFKGGTCLRKCYYETFRFSEDLDFTIVTGGPDEPGDLNRIFGEIAEWLREESGIELALGANAFKRKRNRRGNATTQGRIAYRGPNPPSVLPNAKIDITADEVLVHRPVRRPIGHQYSDTPLPVKGVRCYSLTELFGEKLRALTERCRPRDLYDVVHMHPLVTVQRGDRERVGEHAGASAAEAAPAFR